MTYTHYIPKVKIASRINQYIFISDISFLGLLFGNDNGPKRDILVRRRTNENEN